MAPPKAPFYGLDSGQGRKIEYRQKNERDDFAGGMYRELLLQMEQKAEQESPRARQMPLFLKENKLYPPTALVNIQVPSPPLVQHTLEQNALGTMRSDGTFSKLTELKSHVKSRLNHNSTVAPNSRRKAGRIFGQVNSNS